MYVLLHATSLPVKEDNPDNKYCVAICIFHVVNKNNSLKLPFILPIPASVTGWSAQLPLDAGMVNSIDPHKRRFQERIPILFRFTAPLGEKADQMGIY